MCARFTVLSDAPIAAAIAGCVIPLSRNSTIWMRWSCAAGIFHRSTVFSRRTSALLHLAICFPRIRWCKRITPWQRKTASQPAAALNLRQISIQAVMEVVLDPNNKIVLIGYSGGGFAITRVADQLNGNRPRRIDLLIAYDPSPTWSMKSLGKNVAKAICYCNSMPFMLGL